MVWDRWQCEWNGSNGLFAMDRMERMDGIDEWDR